MGDPFSTAMRPPVETTDYIIQLLGACPSVGFVDRITVE